MFTAFGPVRRGPKPGPTPGRRAGPGRGAGVREGGGLTWNDPYVQVWMGVGAESTQRLQMPVGPEPSFIQHGQREEASAAKQQD